MLSTSLVINIYFMRNRPSPTPAVSDLLFAFTQRVCPEELGQLDDIALGVAAIAGAQRLVT
jgi:hypothetical protein